MSCEFDLFDFGSSKSKHLSLQSEYENSGLKKRESEHLGWLTVDGVAGLAKLAEATLTEN